MQALHQIAHSYGGEVKVADYNNSPERAKKTERHIKLIRAFEKRKIFRAHIHAANKL